ncbi:chromate transporter [Paenibacillus macquariensis]|uniref:Chromate transporter n=1 Tax=Paenibacillus macquariensis TaxID=948756 RepID=A0ABY1KFB0_9BACL|nr:chromate transporter [Paenibacillus macquariensis]MEC0093860.1 chromate transporter [Paenibacillus macquariensis]OAB33076.1 ChrA protein [Paenibacillus macquariensis subsp. macquariensis]SIR59512.1 chromate transporter [Paenibacillus macquariensis]
MDTNQSVNLGLPKRKLKLLLEVLVISTKLGLTSFGGPIAHLGYFHNEYIRKRQWMDERSYADLVALCQLLPGPASSQVGIGIGVMRAGLLGGVVAWIGFTLPSIIALVLFAFLLQGFDISNAGWIHGLKIVAVAIVAQAILGMGQKLTPDKRRVTIAIIVASITLLWQTAFSQVLLIVAAGLIGLWMYRKMVVQEALNLPVPISRTVAVLSLTIFFGLLIALPLLRQVMDNSWVSLFDSFYRSGSFVFGGGHVVLPLLERELVPTGWISKEDFLAGYGATQAVPGPLFTVAAYLGAMAKGISGAIIATVAIFLPAFLLIIGTLPFWNSLRKSTHVQGALVGINAAVVGILLAALYNPLWTTAIIAPADFSLVSILFIMLVFWKLPPWVVVIAGIVGGVLIGLI